MNDKPINLKGTFTTIGVLMVIVVVICVAYDINYGDEWHQKRVETYRSWCKAHNNNSLSYDEWADLRMQNLLPGQVD